MLTADLLNFFDPYTVSTTHSTSVTDSMHFSNPMHPLTTSLATMHERTNPNDTIDLLTASAKTVSNSALLSNLMQKPASAIITNDDKITPNYNMPPTPVTNLNSVHEIPFLLTPPPPPPTTTTTITSPSYQSSQPLLIPSQDITLSSAFTNDSQILLNNAHKANPLIGPAYILKAHINYKNYILEDREFIFCLLYTSPSPRD